MSMPTLPKPLWAYCSSTCLRGGQLEFWSRWVWLSEVCPYSSCGCWKASCSDWLLILFKMYQTVVSQISMIYLLNKFTSIRILTERVTRTKFHWRHLIQNNYAIKLERSKEREQVVYQGTRQAIWLTVLLFDNYYWCSWSPMSIKRTRSRGPRNCFE